MVTYLLKTYFCISVNALQNTANTEIKFTLNITYFFPVNGIYLRYMHFLLYKQAVKRNCLIHTGHYSIMQTHLHTILDAVNKNCHKHHK
jgi:hypothetical protein